MATPPPKPHISQINVSPAAMFSLHEGGKLQQSVRWKTPDNPGAWCLTNQRAHNRTILQTMAAYRKSPGCAATYVENCTVNYLERNFQYANTRGGVRHDCTNEAGEKICAHAGTECLCDIKVDMHHGKTHPLHDGRHLNTKMTHVTRSKPPPNVTTPYPF